MEIIYSFIGCFFALIVNEIIEDLFKKNKQKNTPVIKREIPKNIGRFADPLGEYEQYKDDNNLYKSYVPKKNTRRSE
jgi:hypothetical protein